MSANIALTRMETHGFGEGNMDCLICKDHELSTVLTKQGVEVDYCTRCKGVWLDRGKIFISPAPLKRSPAGSMRPKSARRQAPSFPPKPASLWWRSTMRVG